MKQYIKKPMRNCVRPRARPILTKSVFYKMSWGRGPHLGRGDKCWLIGDRWRGVSPRRPLAKLPINRSLGCTSVHPQGTSSARRTSCGKGITNLTTRYLLLSNWSTSPQSIKRLWKVSPIYNCQSSLLSCLWRHRQ